MRGPFDAALELAVLLRRAYTSEGRLVGPHGYPRELIARDTGSGAAVDQCLHGEGRIHTVAPGPTYRPFKEIESIMLPDAEGPR
jgi:hypothetical protein